MGPASQLSIGRDACFIVRDANRQALAYVYFEEEPRRRSAAHLLTRDKARRIAANVAKAAGAGVVDTRPLDTTRRVTA